MSRCCNQFYIILDTNQQLKHVIWPWLNYGWQCWWRNGREHQCDIMRERQYESELFKSKLKSLGNLSSVSIRHHSKRTIMNIYLICYLIHHSSVFVAFSLPITHTCYFFTMEYTALYAPFDWNCIENKNETLFLNVHHQHTSAVGQYDQQP